MVVDSGRVCLCVKMWLRGTSQHSQQPGLVFMAQTRIKWLLSATRDDSDERGFVGGVGEAGEVGGLGVAH